jgi:hypothetical protein
MAGVTGEILGQEQVDERQADIDGAGVHPGVVEFEGQVVASNRSSPLDGRRPSARSAK